MSFIVNVRNVDDHTQKCLIPHALLEKSVIKASDVVTLNFELRTYICRVFPLPPTEPEICIIFDDSVSYKSNTCPAAPTFTENHWLLFPDSFSITKVKAFVRICVKIIVFENQNIVLKNNVYHQVVCKLIQNYIFKKNANIKCKSQLADLFNIKEIFIVEAYGDENIGFLNRTSIIDIVDVVCIGQIKQFKEFENRQIYGLENVTKHLKFLIQKKCRKVVILGPSGSGKSLFIKHFCCDLRYHLAIIDCLTTSSLSMEKCDLLCKQLVQSSKMFPNHFSVLLVDHMDQLATFDSECQSSFVSSLLYLFQCLNKSDILIIIVTTQRKFLHPKLNSLFHEEIFLGILNLQQQKEIMKALTKSHEIVKIDFDKISGMMSGFVASDIVRLTEDAMQIRKKQLEKESSEKIDQGPTTQDFIKALHYFTPSLLKTSEWNLKVKPIFWKDIGGMEEIKKRLHLSIEMPLLHPEIFEKVDLHCPRGVLLFGPPGCCKTTLARGLATECNANFFAANPSQIYSSFVGESEKNISQLFYQARLCAPSIIFLDELDTLVGCRNFDTKQQGIAEKVLSTLLNEMDGLGERTHFEKDNFNYSLEGKMAGKNYLRDEVIVIAATNRPDCIDDALLRPGRFDVILYVPPPTLEERESILKTITEGMPLKEVSLKIIAEKTQFFSGADLKNLCNMAAMNALRRDLLNAEYVTVSDFNQALKTLQPSITRDQIIMYKQLSNKYGPVISK